MNEEMNLENIIRNNFSIDRCMKVIIDRKTLSMRVGYKLKHKYIIYE